MKRTLKKTVKVIGGRRLTNLRYADDTTLLASTQEKAKKIFKYLILESAQYNMQINAKKTKAMVVTRNGGIQAKLEHECEYLDQVKDFKFLGSCKSADGDCTSEIKRRIAMARQKAVELTTIWKDKNVMSALKIRVMKSMVWAVFQYGVEGWTLKKSD